MLCDVYNILFYDFRTYPTVCIVSLSSARSLRAPGTDLGSQRPLLLVEQSAVWLCREFEKIVETRRLSSHVSIRHHLIFPRQIILLCLWWKILLRSDRIRNLTFECRNDTLNYTVTRENVKRKRSAGPSALAEAFSPVI